MNNLYVLQARIKASNAPEIVKYFSRTRTHDLMDVDPDVFVLSFHTYASDATYFDDLQTAQEVFSRFVKDSTKENNGKTMFEPPFSVLVGGEHTRRTVHVTLELVSITGESLSTSVISTVRTICLVGEEFANGQPRNVWAQQHVNLQLRDNKIAGYNVNPPEMQNGDSYRNTRIDTDASRVIHEAWNPIGQVVVYTCTKEGNLLHVVTPNSAKHLPQIRPGCLL